MSLPAIEFDNVSKRYVIRHENAMRWKLNLPEGCELLACSIDGRATNPVDRGEHVVEFSLPSGKAVTTAVLSYTAKKPPFKPVHGQFSVELPETSLLVNKIDWELRIPAIYEVAAFEGNVESVPESASTDDSSRLIRLRKQLCKNERPHAEFFYQKPEPNK